MIFARPCRHFDGLLGKKYTCSGFYLESKKKGLEFEEAIGHFNPYNVCENLKIALFIAPPKHLAG